MHIRKTPEDLAASWRDQLAFTPPHCPNEKCESFASGNFTFSRQGSFRRKKPPYVVARFRCEVCFRNFSTRAFAYSYWQKRPELDADILMSGLSCSSNRQIAERVRCSKSTIADKLARLGRHALRFHARTLSKARKFSGRLLFDGLWSFEVSLNFPYWLNVALHDQTDFVFGFTDSPLRRSGTMTARQKRSRWGAESAHGRPDPRAIRKGTAALLAAVLPYYDRTRVEFVSDEHKAYPLAIRDAAAVGIPHVTVSSKQMRTRSNPLYAINLADNLLRHTQANHKRETIAFNRRRQAALEKGWMWAVKRNYMTRRRAKMRRGEARSPAQLAGVASEMLEFKDIFTRRIFSHEVDLPAIWNEHVARNVSTAAIANPRRHSLAYAF
jgi:transposase-like protein